MGTRRVQQQVCNLLPGSGRQKLTPTYNASKGNGSGWFVPQLITFQCLISGLWLIMLPTPIYRPLPTISFPLLENQIGIRESKVLSLV
ncbi:hypothetical protein ASPSYDRAFT_1007562 [Aspergillus sydowii CBS 593.65]|uniref:Uncharacterized protein n=1 Tax=Aspergillus sydowii CBS 593.65 TaxID=1036612 RepID=A0A1L9TEV3_9EURO|nr:uncharacterized protein ASPSYDRAFT_1007562 [Aspergillus sydowii CBS 593.65]OJJ57823.1 hypothetical protein ASPSYDRAFT_1007562 [Aspergillus sydowii CBS 593.65]